VIAIPPTVPPMIAPNTGMGINTYPAIAVPIPTVL